MFSGNCVPVATHIEFGEKATKPRGLSVPYWLAGASHSPCPLVSLTPCTPWPSSVAPGKGRLDGVGDPTGGCTVRGCPGLLSVDFHAGSSSARQPFPHSQVNPCCSGAWHLQKTVPRCFGSTPIAHAPRLPAGKPQACVCTMRMKSISRYSGELHPQARDTAHAQWADCWAEETTQELKSTCRKPWCLELYAQNLYGERGELHHVSSSPLTSTHTLAHTQDKCFFFCFVLFNLFCF